MTTTNSDLWREFTWKNTIRFFITPRIKHFQTGNQKVGECWRKCGNVDPPSVCEWQAIVNDVYSMEVLTLSLKQQSTKISSYCGKWLRRKENQ